MVSKSNLTDCSFNILVAIINKPNSFKLQNRYSFLYPCKNSQFQNFDIVINIIVVLKNIIKKINRNLVACKLF